MQVQLDNLQIELAKEQQRLAEAEEMLAMRRAEISTLEFELDAKVGHLMEKLESLESEIHYYQERIQLIRTRQIFGRTHTLYPETEGNETVTEAPLSSLPQPASVKKQPSLKQLYRRLARRFHPDLAESEIDRAYRTEKMVAINNAYAAQSLALLVALAAEPEHFNGHPKPGQSEAQIIRALRTEIIRCRRRIREVKKEMDHLNRRRSVKFEQEVKAASRQGRDLLSEMAVELEEKISRKVIERDEIKARFEALRYRQKPNSANGTVKQARAAA